MNDCRTRSDKSFLLTVRWAIAALASALMTAAQPVQAAAPLYDSVGLNIGLNCQWRPACMSSQQRAMKRALAYVRTQRPPVWKVHQCNRNAARGRARVDWIGYENCIRNPMLRPAVFRYSHPRR